MCTHSDKEPHESRPMEKAETSSKTKNVFFLWRLWGNWSLALHILKFSEIQLPLVRFRDYPPACVFPAVWCISRGNGPATLSALLRTPQSRHLQRISFGGTPLGFHVSPTGKVAFQEDRFELRPPRCDNKTALCAIQSDFSSVGKVFLFGGFPDGHPM